MQHDAAWEIRLKENPFSNIVYFDEVPVIEHFGDWSLRCPTKNLKGFQWKCFWCFELNKGFLERPPNCFKNYSTARTIDYRKEKKTNYSNGQAGGSMEERHLQESFIGGSAGNSGSCWCERHQRFDLHARLTGTEPLVTRIVRAKWSWEYKHNKQGSKQNLIIQCYSQARATNTQQTEKWINCIYEIWKWNRDKEQAHWINMVWSDEPQ